MGQHPGTTAAGITRGDAQAVFHAFGNGGRAVLAHSRTAEGAPADVTGSHGSIRPFAGSAWDGAHFCATDWHVILGRRLRRWGLLVQAPRRRAHHTRVASELYS